MALKCLEHTFTGDTVEYDDYDSTKTVLGELIIQNSGDDAADNWAGPRPINFIRSQETFLTTAVATTLHLTTIVQATPTVDWIFCLDSSATNIISCQEYNHSTRQSRWLGNLRVTQVSGSSATPVGFMGFRYTYSTGTVAVSGTAVTGSSTAWSTARFCPGCRIGFGSTDPSQITTWYSISAIGDDTSITLTSTAGTISGGTAFVIEELRFCIYTTFGTAVNAGLFLIKGISIDNFEASHSGAALSASANADNTAFSVYWLADASTVTMLTPGFLAAYQEPESYTSHTVYCCERPTTTTMKIYVFNIRATLTTVATSKTTDAFLYSTGTSAATTGAIVQANRCPIVTTSHGPGAGIPSIYFTTASRVYRIPLTLIQSTATMFIADGSLGIPPGGTSTFPAQTLNYIDYLPYFDKFIINTTLNRGYITQYSSNGSMWDYPWCIFYSQSDQSIADQGTALNPATNTYLSYVVSAPTGLGRTKTTGMVYLTRVLASVLAGGIYILPIGAHWDFAGGSVNQRLITPKFTCTNFSSFDRAYANATTFLGSDRMGIPTEPYRMYARVTGIDDDSGEWTLLGDDGDLSGLDPFESDRLSFTGEIQLMFEFRTFGFTSHPARIHSAIVTYNDITTDSHFVPSINFTIRSSNQFAWKFIEAFGSSVPDLLVYLIDDSNDLVIIKDSTDNPDGTFEKSTDNGHTWSSWNNTDLANEITFVRYTPVRLPSGKRIRMALTTLE